MQRGRMNRSAAAILTNNSEPDGRKLGGAAKTMVSEWPLGVRLNSRAGIGEAPSPGQLDAQLRPCLGRPTTNQAALAGNIQA